MEKLHIAFLASHNGSCAQAIIDGIDKGKIFAETAVIISNNAHSPALDFGRRHQPPIPTIHISEKTTGNAKEADKLLQQTLIQYKTDVVVLSGYMKPIGPQTLSAFRGRILNIHPALPTSPYKGKGFYGDRVHQAVLEHRETITGAMVHVVDEQYDHGPVVKVIQVPVLPNDTVDSLRSRVQTAEKSLFIQVVRDIARGVIPLPFS